MVRILLNFWDSIKYYVCGLYDRIDRHHVFLLSGGLAFSLFVCTIPLTLIAFSALGFFLDEPKAMAEIESVIDGIIPYGEYTVSVKDIIAERIGGLTSLKEVTGLLGIIGLLIAASGLFSSIRTALNLVHGVVKSESALIGKLWDFALILIVFVFLLIPVVLLPIVENLNELSSHLAWMGQFGETMVHFLLSDVISYVMIFLTFLAVYWLVPVIKPIKWVNFVSALVALLLWLAAKELFGYYISHFASVKHIYGAYTFLIIVAFWIYYSAFIFIVSAEFGQLFGERHQPRVDH